MPKSKNYETYPEVFADLIRTAVTKPVRIQQTSLKEAQKLRGHIYGYFGALKKAVAEKDTPQEIRELQRMATKVKVIFEGDQVIAMPRDQDPLALAVGAALREQTDKPLTSDALKPSADLAALARTASERDPRE